LEYVIDASVAVKWFLPEANSDKADALLNALLNQRLYLIAPDLLIPEVVNTLWKRSVLTNEISLREARESCADLVSLPVRVLSSAAIAVRALEFSAQERHSVYDALYVVLALERGCEFVTADQPLVNKLGGKFPAIRWLGSL
jgi:predicted nucleic acid-binding protein